jgi:uncharacterized protein involved in cysteine biosynthesis
MNDENNGKRKLAILLFALAFAVLGVIPGAVIGVITGFFGFHLVTAIAGSVIVFFAYPASRRKQGFKTDGLTYFNAFCTAVGGGLACFFVGSLIH